MKALSLWQPWASLMLGGWKSIETRGWRTHHRGLLLIAATATLPREGRQLLQREESWQAMCSLGFGCSEVDESKIPLGAILGCVEITDCVQMTEEKIAWRERYEPLEVAFGDYRPGRYEFHFRNATTFIDPIPCKGGQRIWKVRGEVQEQVAEALLSAAMKPEELERQLTL